MASFSFAINYLFVPSSRENDMSLPFKDITIEDTYNSTFRLDVTFSTESPDFLVGEKINIRAILDRIYNDSILPLSSIYFALVTTEGQYMPFQGGHQFGKDMNKPSSDYYWIDYDTYLNFPAKYSCRLILQYYNATKMGYFDYETIFAGPLLEVEGSSVGVQLRSEDLQLEATSKNLGFALLIIMLALINILLIWVDKYDSICHELGSRYPKLKSFLSKKFKK